MRPQPLNEGLNMDVFEIQKQYYDQRWTREEFANSLQASRCSAIVGGLARLDLQKPRMLDLGCGTGWLSAILSQFGPTVGVDLSDHAVREASNRCSGAEFFAANILDWTEGRRLGTFDVVVSQEVIEHVPEPMKYLEVAASFLRHGGFLVLTTPNACTFAAMSEEWQKSWSDQPLETLLTPKQLTDMVRALFTVVEATTIIPGFGQNGVHRMASSHKLGRVLDLIGLRRVFEALCLRVGSGLHTFVLAKKKPSERNSPPRVGPEV